MTAKAKAQKPRSRKPNSSEDIAAHPSTCHELYEQRGRVDGFVLDDWLQAESEIRGAKKPGSNAKRNQRWAESC